MEQQKLDRISELARKSRTPEGLTEAEKAEQAELRRAYVQAVRGSLVSQLENTTIVEPDGTRRPLRRHTCG